WPGPAAPGGCRGSGPASPGAARCAARPRWWAPGPSSQRPLGLDAAVGPETVLQDGSWGPISPRVVIRVRPFSRLDGEVVGRPGEAAGQQGALHRRRLD